MQQDIEKKPRNKPSVDDLKSDLDMAKDAHSAQAFKISQWLSILNITDDEVIKPRKGKSKVQPKTCRKQAEWRYAVLSEPYLSTPDLFKLKPRGFLDRQAARENEAIINYQFNHQLNKVKFIDHYIRTGVNEGTVIVKVCWNNSTKTIKYPSYVYQFNVPTAMQAQMLEDAMMQYEKNPSSINGLGHEVAESVMQSVQTGTPTWATVANEIMVEREINVVNQPDLEICDYRNVIIDPTCGGVLEDAQFIIYSYDTNMSTLRRAGIYENLDKLAESNFDEIGDAYHTNLGDDAFEFKDQPRKKFTVYEYWGFWDLYGDGITVPIVATWANNVMIRCEESPYPHGKLPFAVVSYLPVKNSVYGEPDAELTKDNQRIIGAVTRCLIDTFAATAAGQRAVAKGSLDYVNMQRMQNGEHFEFNPNANPDVAIWQSKMQELPATAFNMLASENNEASAMTGIQPFGISSDMSNDTAAGINSYVSAQAKREFGILRRFNDGLKQIAEMIMAMNAVWLDDSEVIRITDEQFVSIERDNLAGMFDVELSISTQESDSLKSQQIAFQLQTMAQSLPFEFTQMLLDEQATLNRMPDLAHKIRTYKPQPDPAQQLELKKLELELAEKQLKLAELQAKTQNITVDTQLKAAKAGEVTSQTQLNNLDYIHKEKGVDHARDMEIQTAQAKGNIERDLFKSAINRREADDAIVRNIMSGKNTPTTTNNKGTD